MSRIALDWSDEARHELPAQSGGRPLVVDYYASRCCGSNLAIGDVSVRWRSADRVGDGFVRVAGPGGLEAWVHRDLAGVMTAARAQVAIRGWGPFRHPTVEFGDGAVWLEFIGTCRPRGMLRQP